MSHQVLKVSSPQACSSQLNRRTETNSIIILFRSTDAATRVGQADCEQLSAETGGYSHVYLCRHQIWQQNSDN